MKQLPVLKSLRVCSTNFLQFKIYIFESYFTISIVAPVDNIDIFEILTLKSQSLDNFIPLSYRI